MKTYRDLYNYIQTARCDDIGRNFPFKSDKYLHIYTGRTQVNICDTASQLSMVNIVITPDENAANIYSVRNGVAEYDHPVRISLNGDITKPLPIYHWSPAMIALAELADVI